MNGCQGTKTNLVPIFRTLYFLHFFISLNKIDMGKSEFLANFKFLNQRNALN